MVTLAENISGSIEGTLCTKEVLTPKGPIIRKRDLKTVSSIRTTQSRVGITVLYPHIEDEKCFVYEKTGISYI